MNKIILVGLVVGVSLLGVQGLVLFGCVVSLGSLMFKGWLCENKV